MTFHKLIALPTPETIDLFRQWFASAPFTLNYDALHIVLGTSHEEIDADPEALHYAAPGSIDFWYDVPTAQSHLMLPLVPDKGMIDRHTQVGCVWGMKFIPYLVLASDSINNKRHTKAFINSVATMLVDTSPALSFGAELVIPCNNPVPEYHQFYIDYTRRGQVANLLLEAEDKGLE